MAGRKPETPPPVSTNPSAALPVSDPPCASVDAAELAEAVSAVLGLVGAVPAHAAVIATVDSAIAKRTKLFMYPPEVSCGEGVGSATLALAMNKGTIRPRSP